MLLVLLLFLDFSIKLFRNLYKNLPTFEKNLPRSTDPRILKKSGLCAKNDPKNAQNDL